MNTEQFNKNNEPFDFKEILFKYRTIWPYLIITAAISLTIAYFINKYNQPIYEVSTTILLKKEKPLLDLKSLSSFDNINEASTNDEIQILKSIEITERVLNRINFNISYFKKIPFDIKELYKESPFTITPDSTQPFPFDALLSIKFTNDSTFIFTADLEKCWLSDPSTKAPVQFISDFHIKKYGKCNELVTTPIGAFKLELINNNDPSILDNNYFFTFNSKEALIGQYRYYNINSSKSTNTLTISLKGTHIKKMVDFLNTLCAVYTEKSIERKLFSANNTIGFIETQLSEISDSLRHSENKLQIFQASNKVMDMDNHAMQVYGKLETLQEKKAELIVKQKYIQYIIDYIEKSSDGKDFIAPSAIGLNDGILDKFMNELITSLNDKVDVSSSMKKDIPYLSSYDSRIENAKKTIKEYINNLTDATNLAIKNIDQQITDLSEKAGKLPKKQRNTLKKYRCECRRDPEK